MAAISLNDSICGPKQYTIVEGYSFVSLIPPTSGNNIDPWTISVTTSNLVDINSYTVTLRSTLAHYATATPATLTFQLDIIHPCTLTVINATAIPTMTFTIGSAQTVTNFFQIADSVAVRENAPKFCGERKYELTDNLPFLSLVTPADPWQQPTQITLFTLDATKKGQYTVNLKVSLVAYS